MSLRRIPWLAASASLLLVGAGVVLRPDVSDAGWLLIIAPPFVLMGALLAAKRPVNPIGWLFLGFGFVASIDFAAYQYAYRALIDDPRSLPGADLAASLAGHIWHPAFGFFVLSFLLFPNGHLLSPPWRWVARAAVAIYAGIAITAPFDSILVREEFPTAEPLFTGAVADAGGAVFEVLLPLQLLMLLLAGVSLVLRLRRSRGEERQQIKWFVYPVAFVMFAFPSLLIITGQAVGVLLFPLIPASAAVAILKYRLYDIDVVIKRTLVYGTLTATLVGAYLGSVLLLQLVLSPDSDVAIAASTLAVAALVRPARARIQELVNRRFFRQGYDAQQTLESFGGRLRNEVDLDALAGELRGVVNKTMQPTHVSLWIRTP